MRQNATSDMWTLILPLLLPISDRTNLQGTPKGQQPARHLHVPNQQQAATGRKKPTKKRKPMALMEKPRRTSQENQSIGSKEAGESPGSEYRYQEDLGVLWRAGWEHNSNVVGQMNGIRWMLTLHLGWFQAHKADLLDQSFKLPPAYEKVFFKESIMKMFCIPTKMKKEVKKE